MKRAISILVLFTTLVLGMLMGVAAPASAASASQNTAKTISRDYPSGAHGRVAFENKRSKATTKFAHTTISPKAYVKDGKLILDNSCSNVAVAYRVLINNILVRNVSTYAEVGQILPNIATVGKRTVVGVAYRVGEGSWTNLLVERR